MRTDRATGRRVPLAAPEPGDPLGAFPAARVKAVREQLRRDLDREATSAELVTWCRWLSTSGAWAPDGGGVEGR